jgi:hypothetical protein
LITIVPSVGSTPQESTWISPLLIRSITVLTVTLSISKLFGISTTVLSFLGRSGGVRGCFDLQDPTKRRSMISYFIMQ